jgi:hypothetical protein
MYGPVTYRPYTHTHYAYTNRTSHNRTHGWPAGPNGKGKRTMKKYTGYIVASFVCYMGYELLFFIATH